MSRSRFLNVELPSTSPLNGERAGVRGENAQTRQLSWPVAFTLLLASLSASAQEKITYQDHLLPVIENNCAKCHNPDKKKGDLDLTTYNGIMKGGGSGAVVVSGNPDSSKLWRAIMQVEDPTMPPNKSRLPDKELE